MFMTVFMCLPHSDIIDKTLLYIAFLLVYKTVFNIFVVFRCTDTCTLVYYLSAEVQHCWLDLADKIRQNLTLLLKNNPRRTSATVKPKYSEA